MDELCRGEEKCKHTSSARIAPLHNGGSSCTSFCVIMLYQDLAPVKGFIRSCHNEALEGILNSYSRSSMNVRAFF